LHFAQTHGVEGPAWGVEGWRGCCELDWETGGELWGLVPGGRGRGRRRGAAGGAGGGADGGAARGSGQGLGTTVGCGGGGRMGGCTERGLGVSVFLLVVAHRRNLETYSPRYIEVKKA
jgi:hypothetical protein